MAQSAQRVSQNPEVLYAASLERIGEAQTLYEEEAWVLSMYVSGLAIECLLQAFAFRDGATHDARHDLRAWLRKCPGAVIDVISKNAGDEWSRLNSVWSNEIRFYSASGLLRYLRNRKLNRGIKTGSEGPAGIVKVNASRLIGDARKVHGKGISLWHSS